MAQDRLPFQLVRICTEVRNAPSGDYPAGSVCIGARRDGYIPRAVTRVVYTEWIFFVTRPRLILLRLRPPNEAVCDVGLSASPLLFALSPRHCPDYTPSEPKDRDRRRSCCSACPSITSGRAIMAPPIPALMIIDVHNHYYPPAFIGGAQRSSVMTVDEDAEGNPVPRFPRRQELRRARPSRHRLSRGGDCGGWCGHAGDNAHRARDDAEAPERSRNSRSWSNDSLAQVISERPKRFSSAATLPLNDPNADRR